MSNRAAVVGIGWAGFRPATPDQSYKEIIYDAAVRAYSMAGVDPRRDVQNFVTVAEDFYEGTSIFDEYTPDQIGGALRPVHTITGDGLHGLATAVMLVQTGQFDVVAVEGHSKASNMLTPLGVMSYAMDPVLNRPLELNPHFVAGLEMNRYLHESRATREQCAAVVVKNRRCALNNPSAPYSADLTLEEVLSGPPLAWPLGKREAARHADGAVVVVIASEQAAKRLSDRPVWVLGVGWANGSASLESRDWGKAGYVEKAAKIAYRQAGIQDPRRAVDFAEVDDIFAYRELQALEALGLCEFGKAGKLTQDGFTSKAGELPVNVSGGSLGFGDLLDANGLARLLEVVLQLRGEAGPRQLTGVKTGLAQSWRGIPTTGGAVAVLSN
jgi:acetyl-CoA C-acetyltransferase